MIAPEWLLGSFLIYGLNLAVAYCRSDHRTKRNETPKDREAFRVITQDDLDASYLEGWDSGVEKFLDNHFGSGLSYHEVKRRLQREPQNYGSRVPRRTKVQQVIHAVKNSQVVAAISPYKFHQNL